MNKDLLGAIFEAAGAAFAAIGRIVSMKDEAAARRALARLTTHARKVDGEAIAMDAARSVPAPERDDS
jgi:hypothetical protein